MDVAIAIAYVIVKHSQQLGDFFTNFWTKSYANAPLAGRNLILSSFSPQVCIIE